jgi:hypothetical protein
MTPFIITVWGLAAIAAAAVAFFKAPRVGRNGQNWAFWTFIFPPAVALLFVLPPPRTPPSAPTNGRQVRIDFDD